MSQTAVSSSHPSRSIMKIPPGLRNYYYHGLSRMRGEIAHRQCRQMVHGQRRLITGTLARKPTHSCLRPFSPLLDTLTSYCMPMTVLGKLACSIYTTMDLLESLTTAIVVQQRSRLPLILSSSTAISTWYRPILDTRGRRLKHQIPCRCSGISLR